MRYNLSIERVGGLSFLKSPTAPQLRKLMRTPAGVEQLKYWCRERDWVAEIAGFDGRGFSRSFVRAKLDFSRADDDGMHGIYANYLLDEGRLYEVFEHTGWGDGTRYFCRFDGELVIRLSEKEAIECLRSRSESTSAPQPDSE